MIRVMLGFLLVFGAVGGMEAQPLVSGIEFAAQLAATVIGLALIYFGAKKLSQE